SPGHPALIGHLEINDISAWPRIMESVKSMLLVTHNIDHITLQPEVGGEN
ncbi:MAG: cation transporter, partial [Burkholderiales bacterium]|nr:cation transporter [Burkholderiales bacterium]